MDKMLPVENKITFDVSRYHKRTSYIRAMLDYDQVLTPDFVSKKVPTETKITLNVGRFQTNTMFIQKMMDYYSVLDSTVFCDKPHRLKKIPIDSQTGVKPQQLYAVTTIAPHAMFGGDRTPVICSTFKTAKRYLENNVFDLWEYSYHLAVIESFEPNAIYGGYRKAYWFRFVGTDSSGGYRSIKTPARYKRSFGFGVG